ncbi:hypothetical protein ACHAWF_004142 [Thalassiosira exigua]
MSEVESPDLGAVEEGSAAEENDVASADDGAEASAAGRSSRRRKTKRRKLLAGMALALAIVGGPAILFGLLAKREGDAGNNDEFAASADVVEVISEEGGPEPTSVGDTAAVPSSADGNAAGASGKGPSSLPASSVAADEVEGISEEGGPEPTSAGDAAAAPSSVDGNVDGASGEGPSSPPPPAPEMIYLYLGPPPPPPEEEYPYGDTEVLDLAGEEETWDQASSLSFAYSN